MKNKIHVKGVELFALFTDHTKEAFTYVVIYELQKHTQIHIYLNKCILTSDVKNFQKAATLKTEKET
jgi:hypothetical protein